MPADSDVDVITIIATDNVTSFFQEIVEDAIKAQRVEATGGATHYLVGLLADYAHPDRRAGEALARPLAFLLDEALHTPEPAERFTRLRTLGDGILYSCGFFGDHFEARGLDERYLFGIGTAAYGGARAMLGGGGGGDGDLFGELASKFGVFVDVLADVADSTTAMGAGAGTAQSLVKVYERWLRTGSEKLATALTSHGLVPQRGPKGVQ
jgi:hypothetical protein